MPKLAEEASAPPGWVSLLACVFALCDTLGLILAAYWPLTVPLLTLIAWPEAGLREIVLALLAWTMFRRSIALSCGAAILEDRRRALAALLARKESDHDPRQSDDSSSP